MVAKKNHGPHQPTCKPIEETLITVDVWIDDLSSVLGLEYTRLAR
jgi:hypothetical protein